MSNKFSFNKIFVLESLPDKNTGTELYNDLIRYKVCEYEELESELIQLDSKLAFIKKMEELKGEVSRNGTLPFLHFEMHGGEKKNGLIFKNGDLIYWRELASILREINILTENNLFISLATCYGGYIYQEIHPTDFSPFWGYIGPWLDVNVGNIEISFYNFFDELFSSMNMNKAVEALNRSNETNSVFHFYNCEEVFEKIYGLYEKKFYGPDEFKKRVLELVCEAIKHYEIRHSKSIWEVRDYMEQELIIRKQAYFEVFKKQFLHQKL